jgi:hypothetical protein
MSSSILVPIINLNVSIIISGGWQIVGEDNAAEWVSSLSMTRIHCKRIRSTCYNEKNVPGPRHGGPIHP